jgi:DNA adenine methylase
MLKPPLTYYGGKQNMASHILPLIPNHTLYCEPFFGGGAIFFAKEISKAEVINDLDGNLINFYRVLKKQYPQLKKEIQATLYSRQEHLVAQVVLSFPELFSGVKRAWAIWVILQQGYSSMMDNSWGYEKKGNTAIKRYIRKKDNFTKEFSERLKNVQLEHRDAIKVIESRDTPESFFYCDPPYFNSHQKYSIHYTEADYIRLLELLSKIKGKFLLSSYPSEILNEYVKKNNWNYREFKMPMSVNARYGRNKKKSEVLVANYLLR